MDRSLMLTGGEAATAGRGVPPGVATTVGMRRVFFRWIVSCAHMLFAFRMSATFYYH